MKHWLLMVALSVIFVGCSSTSTTPASTTPTSVELAYCPEVATAQLKELAWTFRAPPLYPREALQQRLSGGVLMVVWVTSTGSVEQVCIVKAYPPGVFDAAAAQAMAKWRFKMKVVDGVSVPHHGVQTIEFRVD